ncbi:hypothetical protein [Streptococcus pacificus]
MKFHFDSDNILSYKTLKRLENVYD